MIASKDLANLSAECALRGFMLHHLIGDYGALFVLTREELTKQCNTTEEVRDWMSRIDAKRNDAQGLQGFRYLGLLSEHDPTQCAEDAMAPGRMAEMSGTGR